MRRDDGSITEESYTGSQSSFVLQGKETPILNITANAHRDWTNRKKVGYSDQKNKKNVTFYTPQVSNREYGPHSSRSSIEKRRLNLTERQQKSFIEERSKNLK